MAVTTRNSSMESSVSRRYAGECEALSLVIIVESVDGDVVLVRSNAVDAAGSAVAIACLGAYIGLWPRYKHARLQTEQVGDVAVIIGNDGMVRLLMAFPREASVVLRVSVSADTLTVCARAWTDIVKGIVAGLLTSKVPTLVWSANPLALMVTFHVPGASWEN